MLNVLQTNNTELPLYCKPCMAKCLMSRHENLVHEYRVLEDSKHKQITSYGKYFHLPLIRLRWSIGKETFTQPNETQVTWQLLEFETVNYWNIVCSHGTVFPSNRLELSPSLEYNSSGFIHLSHVKTAIFDIVFWGFHITVFFVFIENTNNWMF